MTRRLLDPMPERLVADQRRAADPETSAWVEANAGSGKTHVLTDRVVRLLLTGVRPESILCLTYTKAAAAEMRRRVAQRLADWALMEEAELAATLGRLEERPPDAARTRRARTLFAHALDTPGGLKVVTIHAFCESVLHRFPVEAGVPFDFTVTEEAETTRMVLAAREATLAAGVNGDPELAGPVEILFDLLSDYSISEAIDAALAEGHRLRPLLADVPGAKRRLRRLVGDDGRRSADIQAEILEGRLIGAAEIAAILQVCPPAGATAFETKLSAVNAGNPDPGQWLGTFLTKDLTVPKAFPKKAFREGDPALAELALAEARRLEQLAADAKRAALLERSEALLDVLADIWRRFEAAKRARSLLDFDDLVEKVGLLFADGALGPWVRYKLDAGITHILVDESQDTNPEQWRTIRAIADEFFVPGSAGQGLRTLFAVGDQKQSIYSFQGAVPELFIDTGRVYAGLAGVAEMSFRKVPLHTSFRTLRGIIDAVDLVFSQPELQAGVLTTEPVHHDTARAEDGGMVTLWPVEKDEPPAAGEDWPLDVPEGSKSAARRTAERIAGEISSWVRHQRPLGPRGRAVTYSDVLVLVQSRNAVFGELIRALHQNGIPTPGADRLTVTTHIAVLDLLALGDVLTNTADDLQLAALLRSPLFDVSEEELHALAQPRDDHETLWQAMRHSAIPAARAAFDVLDGWRRTLDFDRPFGFFAEVLYGGGGLRKFHGRMGGEVDDVFAEFLRMALEHEQSPQPSLVGFLAAVRAQDITIKRELGEGGAGVRVMTVHGAKGLEAPIVILADAASKPRNNGAVFIREVTDGPVLVHATGAGQDVPESQAFREQDRAREGAEYWRKLYVAMTRAEDELYVTGMLTQRGRLDGTWYEAVERSLRPASEVTGGAEGHQTLVFPAARPPTVAAGAAQVAAESSRAELVLPPLPEVLAVPVVQPSSARADAGMDRVFDTTAEAARDAEGARLEGIALHALLQHLPQVKRGQRPAVARRALRELLPAAPERHQALADRACSLLARPEFAALFGPQSRAEVPFLAEAMQNGSPIRLAGRIDRLLVEPNRVLVVDFKSDHAATMDPAAVPPKYLTQLSLYALVATQLFPGREVGAAILWTTLESLLELPPESLAAGARGFTMR
ncbi:MAG TPA: double-strand break repair helicase AddA [Devosiaceae bacterium]|nr:double-strand break repair helicase AddA [Devosiaceae bacterium]